MLNTPGCLLESGVASLGDTPKSQNTGEKRADILKEMKTKVGPQKARFEVLCIWRTRKEKVLLSFSFGLEEVP